MINQHEPHRAPNHITVAQGDIQSDSLFNSTGSNHFTEKTTIVPEERKPRLATHTDTHTQTDRDSTCGQVFSNPTELHMKKKTRSSGLFKDVRIIAMTLKQVSTKPSHLFSLHSPLPLPPNKMLLSFSSFQVWSRVESLIETTKLLPACHCRHFSGLARSIHKPIMIRHGESEDVALKSFFFFLLGGGGVSRRWKDILVADTTKVVHQHYGYAWEYRRYDWL